MVDSRRPRSAGIEGDMPIQGGAWSGDAQEYGLMIDGGGYPSRSSQNGWYRFD